MRHGGTASDAGKTLLRLWSRVRAPAVPHKINQLRLESLGRSPVRERFVLKGAMLLRLWADQPYRSTLDLDLLAHGSSDTDSVSRDMASICNTDVEDDGIRFASSSLVVDPIRAQ